MLPVTPLSAGASTASATGSGPPEGLPDRPEGLPGPGPHSPARRYLGSGAAGWARRRRSTRGAGRAAPCPTAAGRSGRSPPWGRGGPQANPRAAPAWREPRPSPPPPPPGSPCRCRRHRRAGAAAAPLGERGTGAAVTSAASAAPRPAPAGGKRRAAAAQAGARSASPAAGGRRPSPPHRPAGSRPASASPQRLPHPSRGRGGHGPQGAVLAGSAGGGVGRVVTRGRGGGAASEEFGKQAAGEIPRETCTLLPAPWGSLPGLPGTPGTCCPRPPAPAVLATDTPAASSSGCADPSLQPLPGTPEHWSTHGLSAAHSEPLLQRPPLPLRRPLSARSHFSHKSVDHANGVVDQAELLERGERCSP